MWELLTPIWKICLEEAWQACCEGCVPIGAVVSGPDGKILVRNRNRIGSTQALPGQITGNPLAHAEINALIALDYKTIDPHTCSLYTTCEPCPLCLGAFYMSGLRTLYYASRDTYAGSLNLIGKTPYLSRKPIRVTGPLDNLEPLLVALHVHYELEIQYPTVHLLLETWKQEMPGGVRLGEYIYANGIIEVLRRKLASAQEMIDCLEEIYQKEQA